MASPKKTPAKKKTVAKKAPAKKRKVTPSRALVTIQSPADPSLKVVMASELADDEMIEREMMGEVMASYVYQFEQEGKKVTGLSVKGVNEVVRRLNKNPKSGSKIRINPSFLVKEEKEYDGVKGIEVSVFAEDLVTGNTAWGIKFEPYKKNKRGGGTYANTFAVEKALSKAERNAKRKLIAEPMAVKMIEKMIAEDPNSVKKLAAPPASVTRTFAPEKAQASDPEHVKNLIRRGIATAKTEERVIEFDQRTQMSVELDPAFKEEVRQLCAKRLDEITIR